MKKIDNKKMSVIGQIFLFIGSIVISALTYLVVVI